MNLIQALKWSKQNNGASVSRGYGWVRYFPGHTYKLGYEDLVADDWQTDNEVVVNSLSSVAESCLFTMGVASAQDPRQAIPGEYTTPPADVRLLRARLILEEALETVNALGFNPRTTPHDGSQVDVSMNRIYFEPQATASLADIIDGCCDTIYVATGTLCACGAPDLIHLTEVNRANDAKFPGGKATMCEKTGKYLKPEGWQPPDHETVMAYAGKPGLDAVSKQLVNGGKE